MPPSPVRFDRQAPAGGASIPYELEERLPLAHCIGVEDIERAIAGDSSAIEFIDDYGRSDRERWRALVVPFVADPWDGRCVLSGGHGGDGRVHPHRARRDVQLFREWERHLAKFDLDARTITGSGDRQDVIIPTGSTPPLKNCKEDVQMAARYGIRWNTGHAVPLAVHERAVPEWANSDDRVREFLRHRFPGAFRTVGPNTNPRSEKECLRGRACRRAAQLCAVLYMAFRLLLPYEVIGDELGIDPDRALRVASDGRRHGSEYFSGKKCCRNRSIRRLEDDRAIPLLLITSRRA